MSACDFLPSPDVFSNTAFADYDVTAFVCAFVTKTKLVLEATPQRTGISVYRSEKVHSAV